MAWTVRIQNEKGDPLEDDFDIGFDAIPSGPAYPICSSVARYFVTLLNPPQLESFVCEWIAQRRSQNSHILKNRG